MALTTENLKDLPKMGRQTQAEAGKNTLLLIAETKDPTKWLLIGGQRSTPLDRNADSIDATSKDNGDYAVKIAGMKTWSISYEGLMLLSDDSYKIMDSLFDKKDPAYVRLEYPDGSFRTGWASITKLGEEHSYKDVSTTKVTFEGRGPISTIQSVGTPALATKTITCKKGSATDADLTITPATAFVRAVKSSDGDTLQRDTDFTYVEGKLTIKKEYLDSKTTNFSLDVNLTAHLTETVDVTVTTA